MAKSSRLHYSPLMHWVSSHARAFLQPFRDWWQRPVEMLMTVLLLAMTLSLPIALGLLVQNVKGAFAHLHTEPTVTFYFKPGTSADAIQAVEARVAHMPGVTKSQFISAEEGRLEFEKTLHVDTVLSALSANPIPAALVVSVRSHTVDDSAILLANIAQDVKDHTHALLQVSMDTVWLKRLSHVLHLVDRLLWLFILLFGATVTLVVSNTVRLNLRRHEIDIQVLGWVGATLAYIRRPFLYHGILLGVWSGIVAWLIAEWMLMILTPVARELTYSYQAELAWVHVSSTALFFILTGSGLLGLLGALIAIWRPLREVF